MELNDMNSSLQHYFRQQQTPAGWFDLLTIMVDGMVRNAGEQESRPFLTQMGESLALTFPLAPCETVGDLEDQMNYQLARFNWGIIALDATDNALLIRHQALPVARENSDQDRWCNAFCAILEGVYATWLRGLGGKDNVALWRDKAYSIADIVFRYQERL